MSTYKVNQSFSIIKPIVAEYPFMKNWISKMLNRSGIFWRKRYFIQRLPMEIRICLQPRFSGNKSYSSAWVFWDQDTGFYGWAFSTSYYLPKYVHGPGKRSTRITWKMYKSCFKDVQELAEWCTTRKQEMYIIWRKDILEKQPLLLSIYFSNLWEVYFQLFRCFFKTFRCLKTNFSIFFREIILIHQKRKYFFLCHVFQYLSINQQNTMKDLYFSMKHFLHFP